MCSIDGHSNEKSGGYATKYRAFTSPVTTMCGKKSVSKSYWLLMTRDILPGTENKTLYREQLLLLENQAKGGLPSVTESGAPTVLEAATCMFMEYARIGVRQYGGDDDISAR